MQEAVRDDIKYDLVIFEYLTFIKDPFEFFLSGQVFGFYKLKIHFHRLAEGRNEVNGFVTRHQIMPRNAFNSSIGREKIVLNIFPIPSLPSDKIPTQKTTSACDEQFLHRLLIYGWNIPSFHELIFCLYINRFPIKAIVLAIA